MKELRLYKHTKRNEKPNRYTLPLNNISLDDVEEFNEIYFYIRDKYSRVKPTKSNSIPYNGAIRYKGRYIVIASANKFEIVLVCIEGCYRFILGENIDHEQNPVSGKRAIKQLFRTAKKLNIDLSKYEQETAEGVKTKEEIESPLIEEFCLKKVLPYKEVIGNVHHLDLNSSYASRIAEAFPELKPLFDYMYERRHNNNNYFKHVLTNSIGCFQSPFCLSFKNKNKIKPFAFANLSKIAINGTRKLIEEYCQILANSGRQILLTNTDGIRYSGEIYHDENEGSELCQRRNDHINTDLLVKSKGAYQYRENGVVHTIVRGRTNLDAVKERNTRERGEILKKSISVQRYKWDDNKGVIADNEKI